MGQGGKKDKLVNSDITEIVIPWQESDLTGLKESEVKLEEFRFHVIFFFFFGLELDGREKNSQ